MTASSRQGDGKGKARVRALPWAELAQGAGAVFDRWRSLSERDRRRLAELLRESRGRPGNLSKRQRKRLDKLVRKLDLRGLGRDLAPLARGRRRKRG